MRRRRITEFVWKTLAAGMLAGMLGCLVCIVAAVVIRGVPALSWEMITSTPSGGYYLGKEGGIANAIVGSFCLAGGATILACFISIPLALALQKDYLRAGLARCIHLVLDILWGIPSVVYGAIGFIIMTFLGMHASMAGGIIALTFIVVPVMVRAMNSVLEHVPAQLRETAYALGTTRYEAMRHVILRQALPGMGTAVLLGFGRGIGDTAALIFTAGYTDRMPSGITEPVASLPLAVFFQLATPIPEVQQRAYAAALILLGIVLAVSISSRVWAAGLRKRTGGN